MTKVEIVGGDAHVICVSNKIKHIFDFNVKVKFSLSIDESMGLPPKAEVRGLALEQRHAEQQRGYRTVPPL